MARKSSSPAAKRSKNFQEANRMLRARVRELGRERRRLEQGLSEQRQLLSDLLARIDPAASSTPEAHREALGLEWLELEQQVSHLATLHVASHRLHEAIDRGSLATALEEILAAMVGSEQFALFERHANGSLRLVHAVGVDTRRWEGAPPGQWALDEVLRSGRPWIAPAAGAGPDGLSACVPLRLGSGVAGVLAIFALLPQKRALGPLDRQVLELLAAQAGMALHFTGAAGTASAVSEPASAGAASGATVDAVRGAAA